MDSDPQRPGLRTEFALWLLSNTSATSGATITNYVSSIASWIDVQHGYILRRSRLYTLLAQQLRRVQYSPRVKQPVTPDYTAATLSDSTIPFATRCALRLMFLHGLRVHEVVPQRRTYTDPSTGRRQAYWHVPIFAHDVSSSRDGALHVRVRFGKTDRYNQGASVPVLPNSTEGALCPNAMLRQLLSIHASFNTAQHPTQPLPLFVHSPTQFVTYTHIVAALRKHAHAFGIDPTTIAAHTPRITTAVRLAADPAISTPTALSLMRWAPATGEAMFTKYARLDVNRLRQAATATTVIPRPHNANATVYPPR
jgi:hypothetical protein